MIPWRLLTSLALVCQQEASAFSSSHLSASSGQSLRLTTPRTAPGTISTRKRRHLHSSTLSKSSLSMNNRLADLLTRGEDKRPEWAPKWLPTWLWNLRSSVQLAALLLAYVFHITVLCQHSIPLPVQLIPNERGHFQSIGLDTLLGMASLGVYQFIRRSIRKFESTKDTSDEPATSDSIPPLISTPTLKESPWKNVFKSKYSRLTSFLALCALFQAYFLTGKFSIWWEDAFYYLANFHPMTIAMHRSLVVLFGHLSWIAIGFIILRTIPRPQNLFQSTWYTQNFKKSQWLWWTLGGYFVSSWFFNIADFINQWVLPVAILEQAQESVVSQLINPEFNDWLASAVGYIAPCITAPWWEEVLYRGFLLPALVLQMGYKWAIFWNGIIFSIHHVSPTGAIPLAVLGWTWSIMYTKSGNLLTTIITHAMWNSRIFIGSWLGL